jgi:hypothetical protein
MGNIRVSETGIRWSQNSENPDHYESPLPGFTDAYLVVKKIQKADGESRNVIGIFSAEKEWSYIGCVHNSSIKEALQIAGEWLEQNKPITREWFSARKFPPLSSVAYMHAFSLVEAAGGIYKAMKIMTDVILRVGSQKGGAGPHG